jgi:hypothetical protein
MSIDAVRQAVAVLPIYVIVLASLARNSAAGVHALFHTDRGGNRLMQAQVEEVLAGGR